MFIMFCFVSGLAWNFSGWGACASMRTLRRPDVATERRLVKSFLWLSAPSLPGSDLKMGGEFALQ